MLNMYFNTYLLDLLYNSLYINFMYGIHMAYFIIH